MSDQAYQFREVTLSPSQLSDAIADYLHKHDLLPYDAGTIRYAVERKGWAGIGNITVQIARKP